MSIHLMPLERSRYEPISGRTLAIFFVLFPQLVVYFSQQLLTVIGFQPLMPVSLRNKVPE